MAASETNRFVPPVFAPRGLEEVSYQEVTSAVGALFPAGQFRNVITSAPLPAGETYILMGGVGCAYSLLITDWDAAISANADNTTTDHSPGINWMGTGLAISASSPKGVPVFHRVTPGADTVYYLKARLFGVVASVITAKLHIFRVM